MKKILKFIIGLLIVFAILYFCNFLTTFAKIAFPAPILGIIVLFVLLKTKIIKENWVEDFCSFALKYMILFFIPLFVGMINYFEIISKNFWTILLVIFLTTTLVVVVVGLYVENVIKFQRLKRIKKEN